MPGLPPSLKKQKGKKPSDKEEAPPLHIIMNLVCILIPALLAQQVTNFYQHQVELPSRGGAGGGAADAPTNQPFNLKLTLGENGAFMIVNAKTLQVGQSGLVSRDPGLLLNPGADGRPQYETLRTILTSEWENRLQGQPPEAYPDPDQITIAAPVEMDYQSIIRALDFVRFKATEGKGDPEPLFSVISLSPGSIGG